MSVEEIKKELMKDSLLLTTEEEVRGVCHTLENKRMYIRFLNRSLKNLFLSLCNRPLIHINSSYQRFLQDYNGMDENAIMIGLNLCNDFDILYIIRESNNVII